ncbi:MAG: hypothetical protein EZS28_019364 [Streblomastix strix]|uniref:Uncharacterized protein n=1 Tax=Streblomastix strix TaxID=222440 RepID=A0A5J4VQZ2_9EUKA|nr:MAG: hypothetical protein EZS28_019364 [Streblomastix strix]
MYDSPIPASHIDTQTKQDEQHNIDIDIDRVQCRWCGCYWELDELDQHEASCKQMGEYVGSFDVDLDQNQIPCEICKDLIPFNQYQIHMKKHKDIVYRAPETELGYDDNKRNKYVEDKQESFISHPLQSISGNTSNVGKKSNNNQNKEKDSNSDEESDIKEESEKPANIIIENDSLDENRQIFNIEDSQSEMQQIIKSVSNSQNENVITEPNSLNNNNDDQECFLILIDPPAFEGITQCKFTFSDNTQLEALGIIDSTTTINSFIDPNLSEFQKHILMYNGKNGCITHNSIPYVGYSSPFQNRDIIIAEVSIGGEINTLSFAIEEQIQNSGDGEGGIKSSAISKWGEEEQLNDEDGRVDVVKKRKQEKQIEIMQRQQQPIIVQRIPSSVRFFAQIKGKGSSFGVELLRMSGSLQLPRPPPVLSVKEIPW